MATPYLHRRNKWIATEIILGVICLVCGCAIYLLFRSKTLNIYQWCSTLGFSSTIDTLRYRVQDWNVPELVRYSIPDGLYCAAYILIIDAIWHKDNSLIKFIIISIVPFITINSEVLQYFGFVKGTFDIYDLFCYFLPFLVYLTIKSIDNHTFLFLKTKMHLGMCSLTICMFILFTFGFAASDDGENSSQGNTGKTNVETFNDSSTPIQKREETRDKPISSIKEIDELRDAINNTVWTHTTKGDAWLRYEFVNNTVKQYGALPADGEWRYDGVSEFTLSEHRSQYDGKRYIVATFYPKTKSLAMFELPVVFNFRDYHLYLNGEDIGGFIMTDYEWD